MAMSWWRLRGFLDLLAGGVGIRRGRRDPERLSVGDTVDWWRVETFIPDRQLRLVAEMKLPGRAWLVFEVEGDASGSTIRQTAIFEPVGLLGLDVLVRVVSVASVGVRWDVAWHREGCRGR